MKISIYGTGYVGLIAGVCFANIGHKILCYDVDQERINNLKLGKSVLYEQDFDKLLANALEKDNIYFTTNIEAAACFSNIHMMCVGTPSLNDGSANLTYLFSAVENLVFHSTEPTLIIIKSTVPVGTSILISNKVKELLLERKEIVSIDVVSCPEFLAQGEAVHNFMHPNRIIIGSDNLLAFEKVREIYEPIVRSQKGEAPPVLCMSPSSAELSKYASNLFLACKISFMNELSRIAEFTGANITEVINGMVSDKRIGPAMSHPGCGFGGSCFPKDLKALIHQSEINNYTPQLLHAVLDVNINQKKYFIERVFSLFNFDVKNKTIAIWGLAFKPNTDDLRESISCELVEELLVGGAIVQAYDPVAGNNAKKKFQSFKNFIICKSKEEALDKADLLAVMTEWPEFFCIDTELLKHSMNSPILFDGRNMYDPQEIKKSGVSYFAVGIGYIPANSPETLSNDN